MTPEAQLETFIDRFTPEVAAVGRQTVAKLRARLPTAEVMIYDNFNALVVGFGPSGKVSHAVLSVAFYPRWVNLFFLHGVRLDDPARRLKGSGNVVRNIRLGSADDLDDPEIAALIDQAVIMGPAPMPRSGSGAVTIRAIAPRQRPRRP